MRKLITTILLAALCFTAFAQTSNDGTLKFLGIPIDGPKEQLLEKIKAKGFRSVPYRECLKGQFNGQDVEVYVVDNHGTAYRVFVAFPETSIYRIRSEYNHLLNQFLRNDKYVPIKECEELSESEDISYEMTVHKKQYGAAFAYISPDVFTKEQIEKIHELFDKAKTMSDEEMKDYGESLALAFASDSEASSPEDALAVLNKFMSILTGNVWFTIIQDTGDYQIGLYYDNLKNAPNGEDL